MPNNVPYIVQISQLTRCYGQNTILDNITAHVQQGDVIALLGKNGAGKTTLLETIMGFALPDEGEIRLFGTQSHNIDAKEKQRIGFVPAAVKLVVA